MKKIKTIFKNKISFGIKYIPYLVIAVLVGVSVTYAGSLTPPGAPAKTMKSLSDLYELVNTGANTPSTDFTTPATVTSTMNSIESIYDLLTSKIAAIPADQILTGTTIFGVSGTATGAPAAPTFASADETTYQCEALTTDPAQPGVTLQDICGYHSGDGCTWSGSACTGETKTPSGGYMTWYAAKAACATSTRDGQTAGTWRLPTSLELAKLYLDSNGTPAGFQGDYYWSGISDPAETDVAYNVYMNYGVVLNVSKGVPGALVHCSR